MKSSKSSSPATRTFLTSKITRTKTEAVLEKCLLLDTKMALATPDRRAATRALIQTRSSSKATLTKIWVKAVSKTAENSLEMKIWASRKMTRSREKAKTMKKKTE